MHANSVRRSIFVVPRSIDAYALRAIPSALAALVYV